jgi:putative endonuclease
LSQSKDERWYLYILRCRDDSLYTGIARDVAARIALHESGKGARYTRGRGPFELLAKRRCKSHGDALRLEYSIKQLSRAEKERLVCGRRLAVFARQLVLAQESSS